MGFEHLNPFLSTATGEGVCVALGTAGVAMAGGLITLSWAGLACVTLGGRTGITLSWAGLACVRAGVTLGGRTGISLIRSRGAGVATGISLIRASTTIPARRDVTGISAETLVGTTTTTTTTVAR